MTEHLDIDMVSFTGSTAGWTQLLSGRGAATSRS